MTQPPAPPPPPPPPALATLRLHLQGSVLTRMIAPTVVVNGAFQRVRFGQNDIPVYAGPVNVHCESQWLRTYGQADLAYQAAPGTVTEVWYAMPMHQFTTGSIGHTKQKPKGLGVLLGILGGLVLLVVLFVVLGSVAGS